jgi:hypothetical protein
MDVGKAVIGAMICMWICSIILYLALIGFGVWVVIKLLQHWHIIGG